MFPSSITAITGILWVNAKAVPMETALTLSHSFARSSASSLILPMAEAMLAELGAMLGDWLGPVRVAVDTDKISELAEDRAKLWESVGAAEFLSRGEKRAQLGFPSTGSVQAESDE